MAQSTFFLTWESHKNNITSGLSNLQQNGEFVDMTLAADGHMVKVHQMVMALASPYIKDLITSTNSRHPVIFLNKVSYSTLSAILEYVYTGEVMISIENLQDLVQAAKDLHIKGLEDMKFNALANKKPHLEEREVEIEPMQDTSKTDDDLNDEICYFQVMENNEADEGKSFGYVEERLDDGIPVEAEGEVTVQTDDSPVPHKRLKVDKQNKQTNDNSLSSITDPSTLNTIQYTVSNQGSLQMVLNRFVYYLKHCNRSRSRHWRCVDYLNATKCPALVVTKDDVVVQRISAHNHPFHDKRILKKVNDGAIYSAIQEAVDVGKNIRYKPKHNKDTTKSESAKDDELVFLECA